MFLVLWCIIPKNFNFKIAFSVDRRGASTTAYANEAFANDVQVPLRKRGNSRPIQLENFPEHYRSMKADSDYLFSEEYDVRTSYTYLRR